MPSFNILPSSAELTAKKDKHQFPWRELECGQSFSVPKDYMKAETLRPMCSNIGKQLNKKFKMIIHDTCYEVGRIK